MGEAFQSLKRCSCNFDLHVEGRRVHTHRNKTENYTNDNYKIWAQITITKKNSENYTNEWGHWHIYIGIK